MDIRPAGDLKLVTVRIINPYGPGESNQTKPDSRVPSPILLEIKCRGSFGVILIDMEVGSRRSDADPQMACCVEDHSYMPGNDITGSYTGITAEVKPVGALVDGEVRPRIRTPPVGTVKVAVDDPGSELRQLAPSK